MQFSEFLGQVQHRLSLPGEGEALRATRATLTTLGERLQAGEANDLAASLPMEIDRFLTAAEPGQRFDFAEFVTRVAERSDTEPQDAVYQAKQVVALVAESVAPGELAQVRGQLPDDYDPLFEFVEQEPPSA
ncbi:DUF2267 domain-containing protein [Haloarchaeobius amylolyticus]|uniref:DUF2267 domain-containing protein n=1 Tax=Haloarchaeobius amylolyticus TaxID=1198296 RepID=UPI00226DCD87|nr:DUF2267 domain-containing protein [Haloarchaeobius amylolyticus]